MSSSGSCSSAAISSVFCFIPFVYVLILIARPLRTDRSVRERINHSDACRVPTDRARNQVQVFAAGQGTDTGAALPARNRTCGGNRHCRRSRRLPNTLTRPSVGSIRPVSIFRVWHVEEVAAGSDALVVLDGPVVPGADSLRLLAGRDGTVAGDEHVESDGWPARWRRACFSSSRSFPRALCTQQPSSSTVNAPTGSLGAKWLGPG